MAVLVMLAGCGGSARDLQTPVAPDTQGSGSPEITLSDEQCFGDAAESVPVGPLTIGVHNESTTGPANFELVRLNVSFEEADQFLADVRSGIEPAPGELPFIAEEADRVYVAQGLEGQLTAQLTLGTYAVVCVALDENDDIITAYVAGPYTASE